VAPVDISIPVEADEDEVAVAAVEAASLDRAATLSVLQVLYTVSVTMGNVIHEFKTPVAASAGGT